MTYRCRGEAIRFDDLSSGTIEPDETVQFSVIKRAGPESAGSALQL
jgi:hypothetical protein